MEITKYEGIYRLIDDGLFRIDGSSVKFHLKFDFFASFSIITLTDKIFDESRMLNDKIENETELYEE